MSLLCVSNCVKGLPINIEQLCEPGIRNGSIKHLIVATCDVEFTTGNPVTDWEEWKSFADNRKIMLSPALREAEKPETEATDELQIGCGTPIVIQEQHILTGQSAIADNENLYDFDFWSELKKNLSKYRIGWVDCNGLVYINHRGGNNYLPGFDMTGQINHIIPADNNTLQYFMYNLTFKLKGIVKPLNIVNFEEAFKNAPIS